LAWNRHIDAALRKAVRLERRADDTPAPFPQSQEKWPAPRVLKKVLTEALDRHSVEVKPDGGENTVRAVCAAEARAAFNTAYLTTHAGANPGAVGQAWRRALRQAKTTVVEGIVNGEP
jgi:hypothetical protein